MTIKGILPWHSNQYLEELGSGAVTSRGIDHDSLVANRLADPQVTYPTAFY